MLLRFSAELIEWHLCYFSRLQSVLHGVLRPAVTQCNTQPMQRPDVSAQPIQGLLHVSLPAS